jgi:hypothetical protein
MPDDFTRRGESTGAQWVNSSSLCIKWNVCVVIGLIDSLARVSMISHFAVHNNDKSYLSTVFDATVNTLYADVYSVSINPHII